MADILTKKISTYTQISALNGDEKFLATQWGTKTTTNVPLSLLATAVQLATKVDKDGSKVLSDQNFSTAYKTKLDGIATAATANQTDGYLLSRANHTGSQAMSTVTDLVSTLASKASLSSFNNHLSASNPHGISKTTINLGNVNNTSDLDKPVSTATSLAISAAVNAVTVLGAADVNASGITNGQSLVWNTAQSKFIAGSGSGGITAISEATDVNMVDIVDGQSLVWDTYTSKFIPGSANSGGILSAKIDTYINSEDSYSDKTIHIGTGFASRGNNTMSAGYACVAAEMFSIALGFETCAGGKFEVTGQSWDAGTSIGTIEVEGNITGFLSTGHRLLISYSVDPSAGQTGQFAIEDPSSSYNGGTDITTITYTGETCYDVDDDPATILWVYANDNSPAESPTDAVLASLATGVRTQSIGFGSLSTGVGTLAQHPAGMATGVLSRTNFIGALAFSGANEQVGRMQGELIVVANRSTDATPVVLKLNHPIGTLMGMAVPTDITVPENSVFRFTADVIGVDSDGKDVTFTVKGIINTILGSITWLTGTTAEYTHADLAGVSLDVVYNARKLEITATGLADKTISWVATVLFTELSKQ